MFASLVLLGAAGCRQAAENGEKAEHEEVHSHGEEIELTERQMKTVGIETGNFTRMALGEGIEASGELKTDPQNVADVTPLMNGIIKTILVKEGQYVKAGNTVATMEALETNGLLREYSDALSALKIAQDDLTRQQKLAAHGAGVAKNLDRAEIEYERARTTADAYRAQLKSAGLDAGTSGSTGRVMAVKAPISGIVTRINGRIGGEGGSTQPIMTIQDNSQLYGEVRVYEKDIDKIKTGEDVDITLINGSTVLKGKVDGLVRAIDPESKTINVRLSIRKPSEIELLPGMAISAYITTGAEEVSALPEDAVVTMEGRDYIYVLDETELHDGETFYCFRPEEVVKGRARNGFVEVRPVSALPEGAKVVVSKAFYIASMATDHGEHSH